MLKADRGILETTRARLFSLPLLTAAAMAASFGANADTLQDNIKRMYSGDGTADIRVVFGYYDIEGDRITRDRVRWSLIINQLLSRGFKLSDESPRLFGLTEGMPFVVDQLRVLKGVDKQGRPVRVAVMASSFSDSRDENEGNLENGQENLSINSWTFLADGITNADAFFYIGHSRDGGGPDTSPPIERRGHVDYDYYRRTRNSAKLLTRLLMKAKDPPQVIGLLSCYSEKHFSDLLRETLGGRRNNRTTILSKRMVYNFWRTVDGLTETWVDTDEQVCTALGAIDAILANETQADLKKRLEACEFPELATYVRPPEKVDKAAWLIRTSAELEGRDSSKSSPAPQAAKPQAPKADTSASPDASAASKDAKSTPAPKKKQASKPQQVSKPSSKPHASKPKVSSSPAKRALEPEHLPPQPQTPKPQAPKLGLRFFWER